MVSSPRFFEKLYSLNNNNKNNTSKAEIEEIVQKSLNDSTYDINVEPDFYVVEN